MIFAESLCAVLSTRETAGAMGAKSLRIVNEYNFKQNVAGLRHASADISTNGARPCDQKFHCPPASAFPTAPR